MALVRLPIPNLIQGVSQQPPSFRLNQQAAEQLNCSVSVTEGLQRRPPQEHVAKLSTGTLADAAIVPVDRGAAKRYLIVLLDDDLKVYGDDGSEKTVTFPDGKGYLNATTPKTAFRALTVGGRTYILNTEITAAMASATSDAYAPTAVIQVRQAAANDYSVTIDGNTSTITAASGDSTADIAAALHAKLVSDGNMPASSTTAVVGSSFYITLAAGGTDFTISQSSPAGDSAMALFKSAVQAASELPRIAYHGMKIQVTGDTEESSSWWAFDNTETGSGMGEGVWEETIAPATKTGLDATTMPHELVDNGSDYIFQEIDWADRLVGDSASNSDPSFVGATIAALFFYKNRLGFLSGRNVIASEAGENTNFFRTSVITLLDGDPIDITVTAAQKDTPLIHAIPYAERLLVFSEDSQYFVQGADLFTPQTVSAELIGSYASSAGVAPVSGGRSVLFASQRGDFGALREFFLLPDESAADAPDLTAHVPKYLAGAPELLASSTDLNVLILKGATNDNKLYVYNWLWEAGTKIQSAWHSWEFDAGDSILAVTFLGTDLFMVTQRSDALYLDKLDLSPGAAGTDMDFQFHLDLRVSEADVSPSYDAGDGVTTLTLPWSIPTGATVRVVVRPDDPDDPTNNPGSTLQVNSASGTEIILDDDQSAELFYVGITYDSLYTFGEPTLKSPTIGGGLAPVDLTRLQLRSVTLRVEDTGYFAWDVTPELRDTHTKHVYGFQINYNWQLGSLIVGSGEVSLAAYGKADTTTMSIRSDSFMPFKILSASIKVNANGKGRRHG